MKLTKDRIDFLFETAQGVQKDWDCGIQRYSTIASFATIWSPPQAIEIVKALRKCHETLSSIAKISVKGDETTTELECHHRALDAIEEIFGVQNEET